MKLFSCWLIIRRLKPDGTVKVNGQYVRYSYNNSQKCHEMAVRGLDLHLPTC